MHDLERRAKSWAQQWHAGQERKYTKAPYHEHLAAVANLVRGVPHTTEMVAAAYLHDVLEDTDATEEEMRRTFGNEVTDLVVWLTDVSKPTDGNRAARKKIERTHIAAAPPQAKTVKLADLIDNAVSITAHDPNFAVVYLKEKRLLLDECLREGDPTLWAMANEIVKEHLNGG